MTREIYVGSVRAPPGRLFTYPVDGDVGIGGQMFFPWGRELTPPEYLVESLRHHLETSPHWVDGDLLKGDYDVIIRQRGRTSRRETHRQKD